jgi:Flp pilus assembly protein TadD
MRFILLFTACLPFFTSFAQVQDYKDLDVYSTGLEHLENSQYSEAIACFNEAIRLNPGNSMYF